MKQQVSSIFRQAFTLVELAIVLVIIGLLVGGVLVGQTLIREAELRAVTREYTSYVAAVYTFRNKYNGLPGDLPNATSHWGIAAGSTGNDVTCYNAVSTDERTCNGNGNGLIDWLEPETMRSWQQLANAGYVAGQYSGKDSSPFVLKKDIPASRIAEAGWTLTVGAPDVSLYAFPSLNLTANKFFFGAISYWTTYPAIRPIEALSIDKKIDDGMPGLGQLQTFTTAYLSCASGATAAATYNVQVDEVMCALIFIPGF